MKKAFLLLVISGFVVISVFGQKTVVIHNPVENSARVLLTPAEDRLIRAEVLPKARKKWVAKDSPCKETFEVAGIAKGAFSQPNSNQTLVFYSFCQTGNGFGNNGLVLIEDGKIIRSYISEGGWSIDLRALPDLNQNGLNEFALYYSGGMHQGQGGTGVDIMEFSMAGLKGIGWFQADYFTETSEFSYKVSVKTGKRLVFYREKYTNQNNRWRKSGKLTVFKLEKIYSQFKVLR